MDLAEITAATQFQQNHLLQLASGCALYPRVRDIHRAPTWSTLDKRPKWFAAVFVTATVRQDARLTLRRYTGRREPLLPL